MLKSLFTYSFSFLFFSSLLSLLYFWCLSDIESDKMKTFINNISFVIIQLVDRWVLWDKCYKNQKQFIYLFCSFPPLCSLLRYGWMLPSVLTAKDLVRYGSSGNIASCMCSSPQVCLPLHQVGSILLMAHNGEYCSQSLCQRLNFTCFPKVSFLYYIQMCGVHLQGWEGCWKSCFVHWGLQCNLRSAIFLETSLYVARCK